MVHDNGSEPGGLKKTRPGLHLKPVTLGSNSEKVVPRPAASMLPKILLETPVEGPTLNLLHQTQ